MNNNKLRPFLAARKRGISIDRVRRLLAAIGSPPTLSEMPERRGTHLGPPIRSFRQPGDHREISPAMAQLAVDRIIVGEC